MEIAIAQRQTAMDDWNTLLNGGSMKFYSGTRPAAPAAFTLSGNTLLATCLLNATAAGATDSSGVATFNVITADTAPVASGTATFAFVCKPDGTPVYNMSVGLPGSGADIIVNTTTVVATVGTVSVSVATTTFPLGT